MTIVKWERYVTLPLRQRSKLGRLCGYLGLEYADVVERFQPAVDSCRIIQRVPRADHLRAVYQESVVVERLDLGANIQYEVGVDEAAVASARFAPVQILLD